MKVLKVRFSANNNGIRTAGADTQVICEDDIQGLKSIHQQLTNAGYTDIKFTKVDDVENVGSLVENNVDDDTIKKSLSKPLRDKYFA